MYELPEELIAQTPVEPRDHSRLMVRKPPRWADIDTAFLRFASTT